MAVKLPEWVYSRDPMKVTLAMVPVALFHLFVVPVIAPLYFVAMAVAVWWTFHHPFWGAGAMALIVMSRLMWKRPSPQDQEETPAHSRLGS